MPTMGIISEVFMFQLFRRQNPRQFVIDRIPADAVCAEIGVWKAEFSEVIARTARPWELHLIDPWIFRPNFPKRWYGGAWAKSQADMDAIHDKVKARMSRYRGAKIHRRPSAEAAAAFSDSYFDWIYIDGDHSTEAVKADLENYWPKLRPGGVLVADDYLWKDEAGEASVKRALDAFTSEMALKPVIEHGQFIAVKSAA
jgi:hypothetical protein